MRGKDYYIVILMAVVVWFGWLLFRPATPAVIVRTEVLRDTIFDTLRLPAPPPKIVERVRDTIIYVDNPVSDEKVEVSLPLSRYLFEERGKYKLELEGFAVKPISFEFIQPTITNTVNRTKIKDRRFSWGVSGGVGLFYGTKGIDIGIGIIIGAQVRF